MGMFFAQNAQNASVTPQPLISKVEIHYWLGEWDNTTSEPVVINPPDIGLPTFSFDNGESFEDVMTIDEIVLPIGSSNDYPTPAIADAIHEGDFSAKFNIGQGGVFSASKQIHYIRAYIDNADNPIGTSKTMDESIDMDVSSLIPAGTTGHTLIIEFNIWAYFYQKR